MIVKSFQPLSLEWTTVENVAVPGETEVFREMVTIHTCKLVANVVNGDPVEEEIPDGAAQDQHLQEYIDARVLQVVG